MFKRRARAKGSATPQRAAQGGAGAPLGLGGSVSASEEDGEQEEDRKLLLRRKKVRAGTAFSSTPAKGRAAEGSPRTQPSARQVTRLPPTTPGQGRAGEGAYSAEALAELRRDSTRKAPPGKALASPGPEELPLSPPRKPPESPACGAERGRQAPVDVAGAEDDAEWERALLRRTGAMAPAGDNFELESRAQESGQLVALLERLERRVEQKKAQLAESDRRASQRAQELAELRARERLARDAVGTTQERAAAARALETVATALRECLRDRAPMVDKAARELVRAEAREARDARRRRRQMVADLVVAARAQGVTVELGDGGAFPRKLVEGDAGVDEFGRDLGPVRLAKAASRLAAMAAAAAEAGEAIASESAAVTATRDRIRGALEMLFVDVQSPFDAAASWLGKIAAFRQAFREDYDKAFGDLALPALVAPYARRDLLARLLGGPEPGEPWWAAMRRLGFDETTVRSVGDAAEGPVLAALVAATAGSASLVQVLGERWAILGESRRAQMARLAARRLSQSADELCLPQLSPAWAAAEGALHELAAAARRCMTALDAWLASGMLQDEAGAARRAQASLGARLALLSTSK